jgi:uncharacterized protein YbjQ (UPF0145 family)
MSDLICKTCRKPKANFECGVCHEHMCKTHTQFVTDTFSFLPKIPTDLTHSTYCVNCFDEKVAEPLAEYEATMEKAKEVMMFTKDQTKLTGHLKRKEDPITVEDCEDEEEVVLRLAFQAAQMGYNCILDVNIKNKKIINGSHKKVIFTATAIPITIDPKQVREIY